MHSTPTPTRSSPRQGRGTASRPASMSGWPPERRPRGPRGARLDERLPHERRARGPLLVAAVGILVIVALLGAALVRDLNDDSNVISDPGVVAGMPGLAVGATGDGRIVVLDVASGKVVDTRAAAGTSTGGSIA